MKGLSKSVWAIPIYVGNTLYEPFGPGPGQIVDIQPNGMCEQITTCDFITPVPAMTFLDHAMCVNDIHYVCGAPYYDTQIVQETCTGPNGCDSMVTVNLVVMDPTVILDDPVEIGCGPDWMAILNGTGSPNWVDPFVDETTILWTGPGPIPDPSSILIEVTVPGTYCLTITHETFGITCTDMECVDVQQSLSLPDPPEISGPTSVCGGMETYTVSPVGSAIPDGYTWTTPNGEPFTTSGNFSHYRGLVWLLWR